MLVYIHKKHKKPKKLLESSENPGCPVVTYHNASVSIPVTLEPEIYAGEIDTTCCGGPRVIEGPHASRCDAKKHRCIFTITQDIRIAIPIEISTNAILDAPLINCEE